MKQPKKLVNFRFSETLVDDLKDVSERLDIPQSRIARDAVRTKVDILKKQIARKEAKAEAV